MWMYIHFIYGKGDDFGTLFFTIVKPDNLSKSQLSTNLWSTTNTHRKCADSFVRPLHNSHPRIFETATTEW